MEKSIVTLAILSAFSTVPCISLALEINDPNSPFTEDIVVNSGELVVKEAGSVVNNSITVGNPDENSKPIFKNQGTIITDSLDVYASNAGGSPLFEGSITASNKFIYRGTGVDSYEVNLNSVVETPRLVIFDQKGTQTGLAVSKQETVSGIQQIDVISNGGKTGLVVKGQGLELPEEIYLSNRGTKESARVEVKAGASASMKNVYSLEGKTMIQVNGKSSASVENIFISSNSIMNLQTNASGGSEYDTGVIAIDHIDLGENSSIRASVYGDAANYEKTQPSLQLIGKDVTINLSKGAFVDFGGYKEDGDHEWRPDDIFLSADSLTINIADSRSDNKIYFSGVEGNLKVDRKNITLIADGSNNTGNVTDDLNQLANIAYTNTKEDLNGDGLKDNKLQCLGGINIVQEASDIYDGATATVAEGCPNCTITNVRIQDNPNVHGIAEMAALGLHIWRNEIDNMHRRVGELRDSSAQSNGLWTRVYHGKAEYGDQNVTNRYTAFQFGYDRQVRDGFWLGGAFSYTDGDNNFDYGNGDSNLYTFSGYGSWLFGNGVYLDLVGKVGRMKNAFDIRFNDIKSTGDYHTNAASLSAEMGWRYFATEEFYLEPQVQMWYGHVFDADYHTSTGIKVENDSVDSLVGRVGVKMGYKDSQGRGGVFLKASVLHDWEGDAKFRYSKGANVSRTLTESLGGTWYEYGLGADYNATDQVHLYADLEAGNGGEVDTDYRFNVGVRYAW